ncbi:MAG: carboxypeptidase-like regulatory domain-containing protein, partial [Thermoplasmata archaeon]|nr:carboxypeptidase-like regulatory domain-containing protein [Thermoplasmata archaeon]
FGLYWLNASEPGYVSASFFVNATGAHTVQLGILQLSPDPWLSGRVVIRNWPSLTTSNGLGPGGASVTACSNSGLNCRVTGVLSTSGFFNVSAPLGVYDSVGIQANGGSPYDSIAHVQAEGSGFGGFDPLTMAVNVSASGTSLPTSGASVPSLAIFGFVTGAAWEGTSWNATLHRPVVPVAWGSLVATGPTAGDMANMPLDGGGKFLLFCSGSTTLRLDMSGSAFWHVNNSSVRVPGAGTGGTVAPFDLAHFGWITAYARDGGGHAIAFANLNASLADPANKTRISTSDGTNGAGFGNLSAPAGTNVTLSASASGHRNATVSGAVLPSRTSPFALPALPAMATAFFLASAQVNTVGSPPSPSLVDPLTGGPVRGATIALRSPSGIVDYATSNGIGEFLVSAPVAAGYSFTIDKTGYVPIVGSTGGSAGFHQLGVVDLVGDGIAAGRVVAEPGGQGVSGAFVSALDPTSGTSLYTITNGDGEFWIEAPPGNFSLSIQATSFTSNRSYGAVIVSDGFTRIGDLPVYSDAQVSGTVLGRPFLKPIALANVTLCPLNGSFSDFCPIPIPTDVLGGFSLLVPFGVYQLVVNATGYGVWSIELELLPGELLDLGKILLEADGGIFGAVVDAKTSLPIAGASVLACPVGPGPCAGPSTTDASGTYLLANVTPGAEELRASAFGFSITSTVVRVPGGSTIQAPVIDLWPIGILPTFEIGGRVVWNATGTPIGGARFSAVEGTSGFQAVGLSQPNGSFALLVPSGVYRLTASANGARPAILSVTVRNASVTGIVVRFDPNLFLVQGAITGEGTHRPVAGASVRWGSSGFAITGPSGGFVLGLANGTYELSATPVLAPSATEFGVARLTLVVDGRSQWANLTLPANLRTTEVRAVDALTGLGIPAALGTLSGTSAFGAPESIRFVLDPNGSFGVALPDGRYLVSVNASGYSGGTAGLVINGSASSVVLVLSPEMAAPAPGLSLGPWWTAPLLAGAAAALAAAVWYRMRVRRTPTTQSDPEPSSAPGEPSLGPLVPGPSDDEF